MKKLLIFSVMVLIGGVAFAQQNQQQQITLSSMVAVDANNVQVTYTRTIPVTQLQMQCLQDQTQIATLTAKMNNDCAQSAQMLTATAALASSMSKPVQGIGQAQATATSTATN